MPQNKNNIHKISFSKKQRAGIYFIIAITSSLCFLLCSYTLIKYPFSQALLPKEISNASELFEAEDCYAKVNIDKLYYSGFDNNAGKKSKRIKGNYYYYFSGDKCIFFLLNAKDGSTPPKKLENITIYADIISNDNLIESLTANLAKQVGFSTDGLSIITSKMLVCEAGGSKKHPILVLTALVILSATGLLLSIINFIKYFRLKIKYTRKK